MFSRRWLRSHGHKGAQSAAYQGLSVLRVWVGVVSVRGGARPGPASGLGVVSDVAQQGFAVALAALTAPFDHLTDRLRQVVRGAVVDAQVIQ